MQIGISLGILVALLFAVTQPFRIVDDFDASHLRATTAVGTIGPVSLRQHALRLLGERKVKVGTLTIYRSLSELRQAAPQQGTDCSYEGWLASLDVRGLRRTPLVCPAAGQAIKIGSAIVIRVNDRQCNMSVQVVRGNEDPTRVVLNKAIFDVVDVTITERRPVAVSGITFYVRTDATLTTELGEALVGRLAAIAGHSVVSVALRNDSWFITHCEFPILSSFKGTSRSIPNKSLLLATRQIYCSLQPGWPVQCVDYRSACETPVVLAPPGLSYLSPALGYRDGL